MLSTSTLHDPPAALSSSDVVCLVLTPLHLKQGHLKYDESGISNLRSQTGHAHMVEPDIDANDALGLWVSLKKRVRSLSVDSREGTTDIETCARGTAG